MQTLQTLFDTSAEALFDHFRHPHAAPRLLHLPGGQALHVVARFNGPARPVSIGLQPASLSALEGAAEALAPSTPPAAVPARPPAAALPALLSGDPAFDGVVRRAQRIAGHDIALLLEGEAGCGKEVLARALHADGPRAALDFTVWRADADAADTLPRFADTARMAGTGTLYIDEVAQLSPALQGRLLAWLDQGATARLPRIVSASRTPLREAVAAGHFREDLYLRLAGLVLRLPPLREREDIAALATRIVRSVADPTAQPAPAIDIALLDGLARHPWPGNLRQLTSVLRTAVALAAGEPVLRAEHLSPDFAEALEPVAAEPGTAPPPGGTLEEAETQAIRAALDAAGGNVSRAARQLGISRNTIYRKLRLGPGG